MANKRLGLSLDYYARINESSLLSHLFFTTMKDAYNKLTDPKDYDPNALANET